LGGAASGGERTPGPGPPIEETEIEVSSEADEGVRVRRQG
jgi:hypothetical protein